MKYAYDVAKAFADRYSLTVELLRAYRKKDKWSLRRAKNKISNAQQSVRRMANSFRTLWMSHNKPEGIETIQAHFGMLDA